MLTTLGIISGIILLLAGWGFTRQKWLENRAVERRIDKIEG